jgi:hypothetical protein
MKQFPEPWNPEALPPPALGYRYIGKDEGINQEHDELWSGGRWTNVKRASIFPSGHNVSYTYRRPLNVDDEFAPPPHQCSIPGWEIVAPNTADHVGEGWEMWAPINCSWQHAPSTHNTIHSQAYYRRPIAASMNTSSPAPQSVQIVFPVSVLVGDSQPLSHAVQEIAHAAGWKWSDGGGTRDDAATDKYGQHTVLYLSADKKLLYGNEHDGKTRLDARTQMGELIDLLSKPSLPPAPVVRGSDGKDYTMSYTKDAKVVCFGCAKIDVGLLESAQTLFAEHGKSSVANKVAPKGNRTIKAVMLDSGAQLTTEQVDAALAYVNAVNGAS